MTELIERMKELGATPRSLMDAAERYRERAYAPYSKFKVGAAILMDDGRIFGGANVENGSYGLTICAERTAMAHAVSEGATHPIAVAVSSSRGSFCPPCGMCRQFLAEFEPKMGVILVDDGELVVLGLDELLPRRFRL